MQFDDGLDQRQADAEPGLLAGTLGLGEHGEDRLQHVGRDAGAVVLDADDDIRCPRRCP